ncbi:amidohydrolase family protein [Intrasporangium calvum]|uniref:Amidohydrolase 2 n=1 Tax=Intrasporangium calvum (strain ATCC 23552 / DSM 43043 / JCM 3097 / NBRC 12989 / NCIMB 10167 / NRRL B-3866 / 7 KIP) TaxID=710696 RepID=E6SBZ1_INTC7|nr:amidohydrolase family protein [Intrasporangium calvum]ADU49531.1 amidohydrolase 2 [Intrasporangium calvum DSM 43043]
MRAEVGPQTDAGVEQSAAPRTDADVPAFWRALGLPGLADIHIHFLPERVLDKVWGVFDTAEEHYGYPWPIQYRASEPERIALLRTMGVRGIPSLCYAHRPGMARWLNEWCTDFAARVPDAVHSGTFYAEPSCGDDVRDALDAGARLFKLHVQVGRLRPDDPVLDPAWGLLEDAQAPLVLHAGSAPRRGEHTGPEPVRELLRRHPRLVLVIAHMGMSEYTEFADLAAAYDGVHLDTTMVGTDFMERVAPFPREALDQVRDLGHKVVLGTDFPNIPYPYAHQLEVLARWDMGDDWMRAVLWENGARLMGLSDPQV